MQLSDSKRPLLYWGAAGIALIVTVCFATIGDGVDAPEATGGRKLMIDYGHTATWALLTLAFGSAAFRKKWAQPAPAFAVAAGACYVAFLAAVFVLR